MTNLEMALKVSISVKFDRSIGKSAEFRYFVSTLFSFCMCVTFLPIFMCARKIFENLLTKLWLPVSVDTPTANFSLTQISCFTCQ